MDLLPCLLPLGTGLRVNALTIDSEARAARAVFVELDSIASSCPCPSCQLASERIHSHYQHTIADLPWADLVVRLCLQVRKFFCDNATCVRKIFTERFSSFVTPWAWRTVRRNLVSHSVCVMRSPH